MRAYRKLIQVELNHDYYPSGKLSDKDLKIFTLPSTKKILDNYRLILRQSKNTFEIIQECVKEDGGIEPLVKIDSKLDFHFILKQQNKQFFNFTETQYPDMRREVFYFSNTQKKKISTSGFLSKENYVASEDIIKIEDLKENQQAVKSGGVVAYLALSADGAVNQTIETGEAFKYSLNFSPRSVYWQYNVKKKYSNINKTKIIDESKQIKFNELKELSDENERVFLSDKKISLKQINDVVFKLISANGRQAINKILYEKLPYPKISNINKHQTIENEFIAKINIYV